MSHMAVISQYLMETKDERKWYNTLLILYLSFWLSGFAAEVNMCGFECKEPITEPALCTNCCVGFVA